MKNITIDITSSVFPSQLATDAEKASPQFGLQVGQAIQYEWFRKDGNNCRYYSQSRANRSVKFCSVINIEL